MSGWTPTVGEFAAVLTKTSAGDSVESVTIQEVTATVLVTSGGDFFTERIGRYPDSFRAVERSRGWFSPYGSLLPPDSPEAEAAAKEQLARLRVQQIVWTGRQLAKVVDVTPDLSHILLDSITRLDAIRRGLS